eukprot:CAMPEP_0198281682 /NCGR_PEP_ID=MMETSP1449-20131203/1592_1 /TAXON_ID=420275 /ORGANISM="Attheya septentrionalis, Strain CCMP2084" /LENGTH=519 /DNA_ID=CAMNT_0043977579 /DNA_START=306 /DNA_END=1868 /DNA_ORIENTATION=+
MSHPAGSSENVDIHAMKAPIYITIGPPCSGKTTFLSKLLSTAKRDESNHKPKTGFDITIDDQKLVYIKIPTRFMLRNACPLSSSNTMLLSPDNNNDTPATTEMEDRKLLERRLIGKSISSRIYDPSNDEMRWVLQRLRGVLTAKEFQERIQNLYPIDTQQQEKQQAQKLQDSQEEAKNGTLCEELIHAVEGVVLQQQQQDDMPPLESVELFVVESIFRPRPVAGQSTALEAAVSNLKDAATNSNHSHLALAWGNTNTRPREYMQALDVAEMSHRPVHFILHDTLGKSLLSSIHANGDNGDNMLILPNVGLSTLLERSIHRFATTGKYVPAKAILDASGRVENLIQIALQNARKQVILETTNATTNTTTTTTSPKQELAKQDEVRSCTKLELDMALAAMANFHMSPNRTVAKLVEFRRDPKSNNNNNKEPRTTGNSNRRGQNTLNNSRPRNNGLRGRGDNPNGSGGYRGQNFNQTRFNSSTGAQNHGWKQGARTTSTNGRNSRHSKEGNIDVLEQHERIP